jgi:hypothetical protein
MYATFCPTVGQHCMAVRGQLLFTAIYYAAHNLVRTGEATTVRQTRPHCWPSHFQVCLLSFRSWTGRDTMSTSRLTRQCTGTQYDKWRTSQTPKRWSPAVAIRQLPWSFVTWPPEGLPTSSSSPEWVSGSNRTFRIRFGPRNAIFNWLYADFLTFFYVNAPLPNPDRH